MMPWKICDKSNTPTRASSSRRQANSVLNVQVEHTDQGIVLAPASEQRLERGSAATREHGFVALRRGRRPRPAAMNRATCAYCSTERRPVACARSAQVHALADGKRGYRGWHNDRNVTARMPLAMSKWIEG